MLMFQFFALPIDWLDTVKGTVGELAGDFMPFVLVLVGISVAILIVRLLTGLAK